MLVHPLEFNYRNMNIFGMKEIKSLKALVKTSAEDIAPEQLVAVNEEFASNDLGGLEVSATGTIAKYDKDLNTANDALATANTEKETAEGELATANSTITDLKAEIATLKKEPAAPGSNPNVTGDPVVEPSVVSASERVMKENGLI